MFSDSERNGEQILASNCFKLVFFFFNCVLDFNFIGYLFNKEYIRIVIFLNELIRKSEYIASSDKKPVPQTGKLSGHLYASEMSLCTSQSERNSSLSVKCGSRSVKV